jgi:hypothetical protein
MRFVLTTADADRPPIRCRDSPAAGATTRV